PPQRGSHQDGERQPTAIMAAEIHSASSTCSPRTLGCSGVSSAVSESCRDPCEQNEKDGSVRHPSHIDSWYMSVSYLDKLNPEQRRAVEHGVREKECAPAVA